jgi:hypothetical protein
LRLALIVCCIALAPVTLHAQEWREAYAAGDYSRAAALLHPLILGVFAGPDVSADPEAFEALARLYATGLGVPQDPVLACTLFDHAHRGVMNVHPGDDVDSVKRYMANSARVERLRIEHCNRLGQAERDESIRLLACPTAPFPPHTLDIDLAVGHTLEFDRRGLRIRRGLTEHSSNLNELSLFGCPAAFELVRHARADPPSGAARKPRHFLELFTWTLMSHNGQPQMGLLWHVFEIGESGWAPRGFETLAFVSPRWPLPSPPATSTTVEFEMQPDGAVRWKFSGDAGPTGVFERQPR